MGVRVELPERQILQLLAKPVHAHTASKRRVDVECLLGDAPAAVDRHVMQRAHIVQPVRELNEKHTNVVGDREEKLAEVLSLFRFAGDEVELLEFGETLDQVTDIRAKQL